MERSIKEQEGDSAGNYADIRIKKCQVNIKPFSTQSFEAILKFLFSVLVILSKCSCNE